MGEEVKGKACGCISYPVFGWIVLAIEATLLIIAAVTQYWFPSACYVAKVTLIIIALTCCKEETCPKAATGILFWTFAGLEFLATVWLIYTRELYALVHCEKGDEGEWWDEDNECLEEAVKWIWVLAVLFTILAVLHGLMGVPFYQWYQELAAIKKAKNPPPAA